MASFNRVILMGNLTRDPQVRYIPSGKAVTELGLAVNSVWFDKTTNQKKEEVTFVDVTVWGRQAEIAGEYLSKGRSVLIEGRLQLDKWQDKETGQERQKLKVICENMTMVGGRNDGGQGGGGGSYQKPQGGSAPTSANSSNQDEYSPSASSPADDFYNPGDSSSEEDVPF